MKYNLKGVLKRIETSNPSSRRHINELSVVNWILINRPKIVDPNRQTVKTLKFVLDTSG